MESSRSFDEFVPVIDLFAGPGGLSEGFSQFRPDNSALPFRVCLSIEKDPWAHATLQLRAFFRQFPSRRAPEEYYDRLRGTVTSKALFDSYPAAATVAEL